MHNLAEEDAEEYVSFVDYFSNSFASMIPYSIPDILKWLTLQWPLYCPYISCNVAPSTKANSTFMRQLQADWIAVDRKRYCPKDVLLKESKNANTFKGFLPTIELVERDKTDKSIQSLTSVLGCISNDVPLAAIISAFKVNAEDGSFSASTENMAEIYEYMRRNNFTEQLTHDFPFIFVPDHPALNGKQKNQYEWVFNPSEKVRGKFYPMQCCVFKDSGAVIDSCKRTSFPTENEVRLTQQLSKTRCVELYYPRDKKLFKSLDMRLKCNFNDYLPVSIFSTLLVTFFS